jgi:hypothetical protein
VSRIRMSVFGCGLLECVCASVCVCASCRLSACAVRLSGRGMQYQRWRCPCLCPLGPVFGASQDTWRAWPAWCGRGDRECDGVEPGVRTIRTQKLVILDLLSPLDARSNICRVCVCVCVPACLLVRARACARLGRPTRMKPWCGATLHACRRYNAFSDSACQETASVGLKADPPPHLTHPSTTHRSCLQMK